MQARVAVQAERYRGKPEGGIIYGMISPENGHEILDTLGREFQNALIDSVDQAKGDLEDLKEFRPNWFPMFTQRFVSNFIHERIWAELVRRIDADPTSSIVDREPVREIGWGQFKLRLKRHKARDAISAFPTESARRWYNPSLPLDGLEYTHLAVGYKWEDGAIGPAVVSYRKSLKSRALWAVTLERDIDTRVIEIEDINAASMPELDLTAFFDAADEEGTGTN